MNKAEKETLKKWNIKLRPSLPAFNVEIDRKKNEVSCECWEDGMNEYLSPLNIEVVCSDENDDWEEKQIGWINGFLVNPAAFDVLRKVEGHALEQKNLSATMSFDEAGEGPVEFYYVMKDKINKCFKNADFDMVYLIDRVFMEKETFGIGQREVLESVFETWNEIIERTMLLELDAIIFDVKTDDAEMQELIADIDIERFAKVDDGARVYCVKNLSGFNFIPEFETVEAKQFVSSTTIDVDINDNDLVTSVMKLGYKKKEPVRSKNGITAFEKVWNHGAESADIENYEQMKVLIDNYRENTEKHIKLCRELKVPEGIACLIPDLDMFTVYECDLEKINYAVSANIGQIVDGRDDVTFYVERNIVSEGNEDNIVADILLVADDEENQKEFFDAICKDRKKYKMW